MSDKLLFNAATSRFLLAAYVLMVLPLVHPGLESRRALIIGYMVLSAGLQWMIWLGRGGKARAVTGGVVDLVMITAVVHWVGSTATVLVALYFFSSTINTLVVGRRVGMGLTLFGAALYTLVVMSSALGLIPYAPHAPDWLNPVAPTPVQGLMAASIMVVLLSVSNLIVGQLVSTNREREIALLNVNARLATLSSYDTLTSVFNRRALVERLEAELELMDEARPLALAMLDLDKFKRINDERGHADGDALLVSIAQAIERGSRESDVVARYGGDEFLVLFPETQEAEARTAAERIVEAVRAAGEAFDPERLVTVSAGLAMAVPGDTPITLLKRADEAAYRAKNGGGDQLAS